MKFLNKLFDLIVPLAFLFEINYHNHVQNAYQVFDKCIHSKMTLFHFRINTFISLKIGLNKLNFAVLQKKWHLISRNEVENQRMFLLLKEKKCL